jgi:NAD(P)-dependent dehydrogenase (short-subunit alcohol dehydrogenase family)
MPRLDGRVAVVTGATRGVGKGIARVLVDAGATVYATGRRDAEVGIPVRVDHTSEEQTRRLFELVRRDAGRLDLVVANAWGGYEEHDHRTFAAPFWEQPLAERWRAMFEAGLRAQLMTTQLALPLLLERKASVIILTGGWDDAGEYLGNLVYDLSKHATSRLVATLGHELRPHGIAVVGVYPGFTRTESVVEAFAKEGAEPPAEAHSPEYVGHAVLHIAADDDVLALSGTGAQAATYAARYGFVDVDGRSFTPFRLPAENRL